MRMDPLRLARWKPWPAQREAILFVNCYGTSSFPEEKNVDYKFSKTATNKQRPLKAEAEKGL